MIEIYRKGFRLDIPPEQVVTFKKAQNLNGIQSRYAYSNTISVEKTANNIKLLELFELPTGKVSTLMNGFTVDVVLNGSIQLKNQTMQVQKETKKTVDLYLLYSDNALVVQLKKQYMNFITSDIFYKKTVADWIAKRGGAFARTAFVEAQDKSGLYVVEEMPIMLNVQELVKRIFVSNGYTVYGDFFLNNTTVKDYFVAPNQGVYEVYSGTGAGFAPVFASDVDLFTFFTWALQFFNSYASVDDTNRTVIVNQWTNLGNFKTGYIDYSKYFVDYKDFTFQSKLAKINELTYADSGTTFNSFFSNTLSSQDKATYLASAFGTGSLNIFDDSEVDPVTGGIGVRTNGATGESSAIRMMKISSGDALNRIFVGGSPSEPIYGPKAKPVSMRDVYTEFHKDYTEFILSPLIQNLIFRYDDILASTFSLTRVFFIEQQASYWIPLEINFSTKKDEIVIKAMLIKKRKVPSPILNDFNSILLDFKEKAVFPFDYLMSMYPMPPNQYPIQDVIFKNYDESKNRLYINDVLLPSAGLPQVFPLSSIVSIKIEANQPSDITPDRNTDSLYIQVVDTNGGVSNEAFINIKHTGVASLESNFNQPEPFSYERYTFDIGGFSANFLSYIAGQKPNLNNTVTSVTQIITGSPDDSYNLVQAVEAYVNVKVTVNPFTLYLRTENNGIGKARAVFKLYVSYGSVATQLYQYNSGDNQTQTIQAPRREVTTPSLPSGTKIRVYAVYSFDNRRGSNSGSMDVQTAVSDFSVDISTIKTV